MNSAIPYGRPSNISRPAAQLAVAGTIVSLLALASLHVLSPEFDPSWRMVSEYANGHYGWVLSIMFVTWGVSTYCAWTITVARQAMKLLDTPNQ